MSVEITDEFLRKFVLVDNLFFESPVKQDLLWKVLDGFMNSSRNAADLKIVLDRVFSEPVGAVLSFFLQDHDLATSVISSGDYKLPTFFQAIAERFALEYARANMRAIHPLFLEVFRWNEEGDVVTFHRADRETFDVFLDASSALYLTTRLVTNLAERISDISDEEIKSLSQITAKAYGVVSALHGALQSIDHSQKDDEESGDE